jgi:hypothetical protein
MLRRPEGNVFSRRQCSTSIWTMVGTTKVDVPPASTQRKKAAGSNLGMVMLRAPRLKNVNTLDPLPCESGPAWITPSSGVGQNSSESDMRVAVTRQRSANMAPFGRPVVPDVYKS